MSPEFAPYPFTSKHYPATPRDAVAGSEPKRHPVVVVGGGPVGYCTALGLASHGVPVVLVEADDSVCFGSRAICISRRSLEIVERLGALDGFLRDGLPWTGGRSFYRDTEVLHFTMPHRREPEAAADGQPRPVQHRAAPARRGAGPARPDRHSLADPGHRDRATRPTAPG